jgi:hypothetical protein
MLGFKFQASSKHADARPFFYSAKGLVMKRSQLLRHAAAWLAACGMCLPGSFVMGHELAPLQKPATAAAPTRMAIHDVALLPGGTLTGQILDAKMQPRRAAAIVIQSNGQSAATTTTDANGVFAVTGLRGGVHQVVVDESIQNCRLWAPGTAPPHAASQLRFIPGQENLVRGQWGPPPSSNTLAGWFTNPWVIAGVVAAAIAVPVVLHNLDDDDAS